MEEQLSMTDMQVYSDAAILGSVAGIRSMATPAIVSHLAHEGSLPADSEPMVWLSHSGVAKATAVLAVGELIADKLPVVPSRTDMGPLVSRGISGALGGAAVASARKRPAVVGALIGASTAVLATFAVTNFRRAAKERTGVPDFVWALLEDAVVIASGLHVVASQRSQTSAA